MKTFELRNLASGTLKEIDVSAEITMCFNSWKEKFEKETSRQPNEMDFFYAGYILSNPMVRDKYRVKEIKEKERSWE